MTKQITVTAKQLAVLRQLAQPGVKANYSRYMGRFNPTPYYNIWGGGRCTAQVKALIAKGLVKFVPDGRYGDGHAVITDAGREYLAEHEQRQ
jgi:hypothetical protein